MKELIDRVQAELAARRIRLHPHFWLSTEWFSPQDVPGVAVPFYLAHPRLMAIERRQMLSVEGGTRSECLKILRHEVGHAVQQAFRLHRLKRWQRVFGRSSEPYPDFYRPTPGSQRHVVHLDRWYGQSHPDEDFAETFAVWLNPLSRWRARYRGWPAMAKLECVDALMTELARKRPSMANRERVDPLSRLDQTLAEHYAEKRERFAIGRPGKVDDELMLLFSDEPKHAGRPAAAAFLRRNRHEIRARVAPWVGRHSVTLEAVLKDVIIRARQLGLRAVGSERQLLEQVSVLMAVLTMEQAYRTRVWHAL